MRKTKVAIIRNKNVDNLNKVNVRMDKIANSIINYAIIKNRANSERNVDLFTNFKIIKKMKIPSFKKKKIT